MELLNNAFPRLLIIPHTEKYWGTEFPILCKLLVFYLTYQLWF